jgi:hypothetical protein
VRLRLRFTKHGKVRWTSHRDVARIWERGLRRAGLPVAYTQGFSPRPKLSFGFALPTGYESDAEYLDVSLDDTAESSKILRTSGDGQFGDDGDGGQGPGLDLAGLPDRLTPALPGGFAVTAVDLLHPGDPSLQELVTSCSWWIELRDVASSRAVAAVEAAVAARTLPLERSRKGHEAVDDLRPGILSLGVGPITQEGRPVLLADLATQPRALRPSELLAACFAECTEPLDITHRVRRTHQWFDRDGARQEPLLVTATSQPHAIGACA